MQREDDDPMDSDFDRLIATIRVRDGTPRPDATFTYTLETRLSMLDRQRRSHMHEAPTVVVRPSSWSAPHVHRNVRLAALAATVAVLLASVGSGLLDRVRLPGSGQPNIAAPLTGTPEMTGTTSSVSPVAVDRTTSADCLRQKSYYSSPGGSLLLRSPQLFSREAQQFDRMQLQHWSFGVGFARVFDPAEMTGAHGLVMDTVTNGIYRGTFRETVVTSTAFEGSRGFFSSELTSTVNTVELGVGESVLFEVGTEHEIENISESRGLGVERLILYSGTAADLLPELGDVPPRPSERIRSADSAEPLAISVRLDGTGSIALDEVPLSLRNIVIYTEFVGSDPDDPLTVLVPPTCESQPAVQVRDVDEMLDANGQYAGYLVWFWEGGRG